MYLSSPSHPQIRQWQQHTKQQVQQGETSQLEAPQPPAVVSVLSNTEEPGLTESSTIPPSVSASNLANSPPASRPHLPELQQLGLSEAHVATHASL